LGFRQCLPPNVAFCFSLLALPASAVEVSFEQDIRPIFEQHCLKCHGPEKQKAAYRLDAKRIALTGGDSHAPNIIPGKAADSPLVRFISGEDEDVKMPPKGKPLAETDVAKIRAWIDAGAPWPDSASAKVDDPLEWCR
jgi:mono/diheme cytochrome c family protein